MCLPVPIANLDPCPLDLALETMAERALEW
jgi:hypothetical protein